MRFLMRLVAGQVVSVAALAVVALRWPHTAAVAEAGLRTFAFMVVAVAGAVIAAVGVHLYRNQRREPFL